MNQFCLSTVAVAVMIAALATPALPQTCSTPSFTHPPIYPVGTDIRSVASADFNGDGRPDLVTANAESSSVSVLTNVGLGVPAINNSHSVGSFPLSVAAGDFTGDGKPDIVTANNSSSNITLLRNDGTGNFVSGGNILAGGGPQSLAVGDFNGNGNLDVAVATGFNIVVLLGNGQGGFAAPINVIVQGGPTRVITADFNNDGKLDLAVVSDLTRILLGNGTGNFPTQVCTFTPANGLAAGDVNGDGKLDLVTAHILSAQIQVRLGDGQGCFGAPTSFDVLNFGRPGFAALGDLNNDGKLDIVAGATVLLGDGMGGFGNPTAYGMSSLGADPGANTVLADFDGDSNLDIASGARGSAGILFGNGAGGFKFAVGPAGRGAFGIARADLNGDGKLDVVAMTSGNFAVMLGDGTGNLSAPSIIPVPSASSFAGPVIADFNRDTKLDVAVLDFTANGPGGLPRLHVLIGNGLGGFGSAISTSFNGSQPAALAGGDFNGDGNPDLLTVNRGGGNNNEGSISIALGDGTGNFAPPPNLSVRTSVNPKAVGIADLNGDGKIDLAVPSGFGFTIMLGNGLGGFGPGTHITTANASSIAVADLNGDNKPDLAMISEEQNGKLSVLFGDGMGGFSMPSQFVVGNFPSDMTVADFNGDSKADVAVSVPGASTSLSSISVLFGDGMGGFGPASTFAAERTPTRIVSGDFNGDLRPDLITANTTNNLTVLISSTALTKPPLVTLLRPTYPEPCRS